jgi:hypothetical protein
LRPFGKLIYTFFQEVIVKKGNQPHGTILAKSALKHLIEMFELKLLPKVQVRVAEFMSLICVIAYK